MQLSRYERIEEEGESRSGNYEKESERASEQGRASHRIAAGLWLEQRRRRRHAISHIPGPVNAYLKDHILNTETDWQGMTGRVISF